MFADPAQVHPVAHEGPYHRVPGIALSEPSVQRTPALYQAGTSPVGRAFVARHAEGVFLSTYKPEMARGSSTTSAAAPPRAVATRAR